MEEVIAVHGEECVFIGTRPISIVDCYKQVHLMLGFSASQWAKNRQNHKAVLSKYGYRELKNPSPLGEFFRNGLVSDSTASTVYKIEELLNKQARDAELAADPYNKSLHRAWKTSKRLAPLQVLQALRETVPVELPKLKFDYFHMHEQGI
jgi:hypothetical protein